MTLIFYIFVLSISIFVLIRSSYYVVQALAAIAHYARISQFILSFALLAVTTSLSELTVGINAAVSGVPEISLGDVFGTNIVNLTLVLGLVTIIGKGIQLKNYAAFKKTRLSTLLLVAAPFVLLLDGTLSRIDGLILLTLFFVHMLLLARNRNYVSGTKTLKHSLRPHVQHKASSRRQFHYRLIQFFISAIVLLCAAYGVVFSINALSALLDLSSFFLGLFIVAVGTSIPELTVGLRSARSGKESLSLGNVFGAIIVNSTLVLGVVSTIHPIHINESSRYIVSFLATVFIISVLYVVLQKSSHEIKPRFGYMLLVLYGLFIFGQALLL